MLPVNTAAELCRAEKYQIMEEKKRQKTKFLYVKQMAQSINRLDLGSSRGKRNQETGMKGL